ncbi:unnamed protein product [Diabrotica balteata]|uniref:Saposin B-type domain-containing protein n=1 Tax=Diabrotica balteata TaxID=107213 RepID=A0A9N9T6X3_DIABA|nr:unnamed protein product [Diabrotica balteata]
MKTILILALLSCVALTIYAQGPEPEPTHEPEPEPTDEPDEFKCDVCITFGTIIKDYVDEKVPLEEVKKDADRLCHDLADHLKEICEKDLLPNLDKIYEGLHEHTPEDLCEHLHYCGRH